MTTKNLIQTLNLYINDDKYLGLIKSERQDTSKILNLEQLLRHSRWCCKRAIEFAQYGKMDKAYRWLGFVQGVLAAKDFCTIDDLKSHNAEDK